MRTLLPLLPAVLAILVASKEIRAGRGDSGAVHATEAIVSNDNTIRSGVLRDGVLRLNLEVRSGELHPEEDGGPGVPMLAFAELGKPLKVPGPMIRVDRGTEIRVTVRNPFRDSTLKVFGLHDHAADAPAPLVVPAGESRVARFRATIEGTYYYWATTGDRGIDNREWFESQLTGALIVDQPGSPRNDRVFVLGVWFREGDSTVSPKRLEQDVMVINGKSWPHTERLSFTQGDTVHWRWINPTVDSHPMHLHGFYYTMESRGDWARQRPIGDSDRNLVVTNLMMPGETMKMWWVPERAGNWVFHCHFAFHVSHHLILPRGTGSSGPLHAHADSAATRTSVASHRMAGLVLGLHVIPKPSLQRVSHSAAQPRRIRLLAQTKPNRFGKVSGFGYVVQSGGEPKRDSIEIPGPLLVLKRGQPVAINVVNHLREATAVHWHGIELESFPDGVPGWSGSPGRIMPPIAPADSFLAEFVPPRAGTFIYHTHNNEQLQMGGGLYGALIVVPPDKPYDPETDKLFIAGGAGPSDSMGIFESPGVVNGTTDPPPVDMKMGKTYRLRFIQINPDRRVVFSLMSESALANWRPVAVDGADLPESQRIEKPAWLLFGPGQTADFEFTPASRGDLRLEVKTFASGWIIPIRVRVR